MLARYQGWRPLGFFSAQLDKAQVNYSAFDRELFAVVAAIKYFRFMLEGRPFTVFTDHRPLVGALSRRSDPCSSRQQRHLSFIAEFSPVIRHIAGQSNVVADTLSRPAGGNSVAASVAQSEDKPPLPASGGGLAASGRAEVKAPSGSSAPFFPPAWHRWRHPTPPPPLQWTWRPWRRLNPLARTVAELLRLLFSG
jgi:hypothetical protein